MAYPYPIQRSNDVNLRIQIMEALQDIDLRLIVQSYWPAVKNWIETGETFTIKAKHQLLVWEDFTFSGGTLYIEGDLVIL